MCNYIYIEYYIEYSDLLIYVLQREIKTNDVFATYTHLARFEEPFHSHVLE